MKLNDLIASILHENSGGIEQGDFLSKITYRCMQLTKAGDIVEELEDLQLDPFVDAILAALEQMKNDGVIGMLEYLCPVEREEFKKSTFIYIPLTDEQLKLWDNKERFSRYYFCLIDDTEEELYGHFFIVLKSFWNEHKYFDDRHISEEVALPPGSFIEVQESVFNCVTEDTIPGGRKLLLELGLEENNAMRP